VINKIGEVAERLGVTYKSLHDWIKKYGDSSAQHQSINERQNEIPRLKAELRRVTEERDILKEAAVDSIVHCNRYSKMLNYRGLTDEAEIYAR